MNDPEKLKDTDKPKKEKSKKKKDKGSRGIETMFRTTMSSHLQLSSMADNKANLMISINSIIVSIIISSFLKNLEEMPQFLIPTILLTALCLVTITFALLSTRPRIKPRPDKQETVRERKVDLLFFGDFMQLTPDAYKTGIKEILANNELLYDSMIDNIYAQGRVLEKKFRLLKIAYNLFMIGFPIVVLCYAIAFLV